jgi:hypothetical protein
VVPGAAAQAAPVVSRPRARLGRPRDTQAGHGSGRAFRGLFLVFFLSFLNLVGLILTTAALGGLAPWSRWQFLGAFGVIEAAAGLANVITPNIWRLPVSELETSGQTKVRLAASALLLPHWGGLARCAAGVVCLGIAAWHESVALSSVTLLPLVLALAWAIVALSAVLARAAVARPEVDVVQLVVRWGGGERELRPLSISASVLQFLLAITPIPAVKLLPPTVLFGPELAPSVETLLIALALAGVLLVLVVLVWPGGVRRHAPPEQQREAEEHA